MAGYGNPDMAAVRARISPPEVRFERRCEPQPNGCINWTGRTNGRGYGQMKIDGKSVMVHRYAWFLAYGTWPQLVIDHLCQNTRCVNVDHREDVHPVENSQRVAQRRTEPRKAYNPRKDPTKCRSGKHDWIPENLTSTGKQCRLCWNEWNKQYMRNKRAK